MNQFMAVKEVTHHLVFLFLSSAHSFMKEKNRDITSTKCFLPIKNAQINLSNMT